MLRGLTAALALVLAPLAARADVPQPLGPPDILGARSLALSGFRGVTPGNDAIFYNPAAIVPRRRYALEFQYLLDRVGADPGAQLFGASVVDSTSPLAGGFAWTRFASGAYIGNAFNLALASRVAEGVYAGIGGKYLVLDGPSGEQIRDTALDAGLFWSLSSLVTIGAAGYNLVRSGEPTVMPRGIGVGIGVGNDRSYNVGADWRADFDRQDKTTHAFGIGAEYLVADLVPVRAGYLKDDILGGQWWSVGLGLVTSSGVALDLSFRQSFDEPSRRTLAAALKVIIGQ